MCNKKRSDLKSVASKALIFCSGPAKILCKYAIALWVSILFSFSIAQACPNINLAFTPNFSGCTFPRTVNFQNNSTGTSAPGATYYFKIGNNYVDTVNGLGTGTGEIATAGTYTVWMVVDDGNGCRDSISTSIVVNNNIPSIFDPSTGAFNQNPVWENCIFFLNSPDSFRINVQANGPISNYRIIWGDFTADDTGSNLATGAQRSHLYTFLGTFQVQIIITNGGCTDTIVGSVINERIPTAGIIGPPAGGNVGCVPHTIRFINNSYNVSANTIFSWQFGDGTTLNLPSTTALDTIFHTYNTGVCNGQVSVTALNACGSSTATWAPIFINDRDIANITVDVDNCDPTTPFIFYNTSVARYCTNSPRLFFWDFGDGTTVGWTNSTAPQVHYYTRPGIYTVRLLDSNNCGVDTFILQTPINFVPDPGFIINATSGCAPLNIQVIDTSYGLNVTRIFNFGSSGTGNTSTDSIANFTYNTPGTYQIILSVTNDCGTSFDTVTVTVWPEPIANFGNINNSCVPKTVNFNNTSTVVNSNARYFWDFGDGDTSNLQNPPAKIYQNAGQFTVRLIVYDTCGTDTFSRTFFAYPRPNAGFDWDSICFGFPTPFFDTSTIQNIGPSSITTRSWTFGDGGNSSGTNPTRLYSSPGSKNVRLIVTSNRNCRDTSDQVIFVVPTPDASGTVSTNDSICLGNSLSFDGSSIANFGTVNNSYWQFGDGNQSAQEDTNYTYQNFGNFNSRFISQNNFGCLDTFNLPITIHALPVPDIRTDTACIGQTTFLFDQSTVANSSITSWDWDLDFNGSFDSSTQNTSYIFNTVGTQQIRLRVRSAFQCEGIDTFNISVFPLPSPGFTVDSNSICENDSITLNNTSTGASSYFINFGDGSAPVNIITFNSYKYAYQDSGTYTITLVAISDRGCADSTTRTVTVRPAPEASFTVNQQIACAPFNFVFTNTSIKSTQYQWFTENTFTGNQVNRPDTLITNDTNRFRVRLIAFNNASCPPDTFVMPIGTAKDPEAQIAQLPDSGCGPLIVNFTDQSQFAVNRIWNFGNGISSSDNDTSVRFLAANTNDTSYFVRLISINWLGCRDTTYDTVKVFPQPNIQFTQSQTDSCGPLTVNFINTSQHNAGGNFNDLQFEWSFGNGISSNTADTSIRYIASNTIDSLYSVRLIGTSLRGCKDTANSVVRVYPNPNVSFTTNQMDSCGPFTVNFNNTSIPNNGGNINIMSFVWNYGQGTTSIARDSSIRYPASLTQDSVFNVTLIGFSEHGCPDTFSSQIRSYPKPLVTFTQTDTAACGPLLVSFTNNSVPFDTSDIGDMSFQWDFGNGITSTARDTTVRFISAAANDTVYTIRLIGYSEHGCADTFLSYVRVFPGPVSIFSPNQNIACAPFNFSFTNNSINADTFIWLFNNQVTHIGNNRPDTLISTDSTIIEIGLIAVSGDGCPSDTSYRSFGTARDPIAQFISSPDSGCGPLFVNFTNQSQFASTYAWSFGNANTSTNTNPNSTFIASTQNDSTYNNQLIAFNWLGCSDTIIHPIIVFPNPDVDFNYTPTDSCGPALVSFTNTSIHNAGGNINDMRFEWSFGNGVTSSSQDTSVNFIASLVNDTIYQVKLKGFSRNSCPDSIIKPVRIYPNPLARFNMSQSDSCGPFTVNFTNTSIPNDTGSISIMSFIWNFGDGNTSNSRNPSHIFNRGNQFDSIYNITLTAISEHGCIDTATNLARAYPKPIADFELSDTSGCGPLLVNFTNNSIPNDTGNINIMSFSWNFGNGVSSSASDTSVQFIAASINDSIYNVRLIASSEHGCLDTLTQTVRVHPKPTLDLDQSDTLSCDPLIVDFEAINVVNAVTFAWNFGDGNTSTANPTSHAFRGRSFFDTIYNISLVGYSLYGCPSDTARGYARVLGMPQAEFIVQPDSVCASSLAQMINNSLGAIRYLWDFGNGDTSSAVSPGAYFTLNPNADTVYNITMVAENIQGCLDTALGNVVISPTPTARIFADTLEGCGPLTIQFSDSSIFGAFFDWNFGNGQTSTLKNPQITFTNTGQIDSVFQVRMITTNLGGCTDTAFLNVRVYPKPLSLFSANPNTACGPANISFNNSSTPFDTGSINNMTFIWDLGNGNSSTLRNPSSNYIASLDNDTIYLINLIAISEHGCRDTSDQNIRIFPKPIADFSMSDTSGCGPIAIAFTNNSDPRDTGNISMMNFVWNFGNGFISYTQDDTITYSSNINSDTVFNISLIAISEHGCRDTARSTFRVHPKPSINFTSNINSGCGPLNVNFTSTSTNVNSFKWYFGNGDSSTAVNPSYTFTNNTDIDQVYNIRLSGNSAFACLSDTIIRSIIVRPDPVAAFSKSADSVCGSTQITFSNESLGANSYSWLLGNGNTSNSTNPQQNYVASFANDTSYIIRLVATTAFGCRDTIFDTLTLFPRPIARYNTNVNAGCTPLNVNFNDSSHLAQSYLWSFGNGNTSTNSTSAQAFNNNGFFDTLVSSKLVITSLRGCRDSITQTVRVYPLPSVNFTANNNDGCGPLNVNFNNNSTPNDTGTINIMTFSWDFGNGLSSNQRNPSTQFISSLVQDSIYTVSLIGFSEHSCVDTASRNIRVYPKPLAMFSMVDSTGCAPLSTSFINQSTPYDTGSINDMSFLWNFGNGLSSISRDDTVVFNASYSQDTTYNVSLIATSEHGCRDTINKNVIVRPDPVISLTADRTAGCGPLTVNFSSSGLNINQYFWDFGNGTTSNLANPSAVFQNRPDIDTVYQVRLWANSSFSCVSDTQRINITVRPDPVAAFSKSADSVCGNTQITFSNETSGANSLSWTFGNGNSSNQANPQQNYVASFANDTSYIIRLVATTAFGCRDTIFDTLTLFPRPIARYNTNVNAGCTPLNVNFNDSSHLAQSYLWSFGNGNTSTNSTSAQAFNNNGFFDTLVSSKLVITSLRGCRDSITQTVRVYPLPSVNFTANNNDGCGPLNVNFNNNSTPNDTGTINIMTFSWDFGNGLSSNQRNPSTQFISSLVQDSIYTVSLIGFSEHSCVDTASRNIRVYPKPLAMFSMVDSTGCAPLSTSFINQSTPYDTGSINDMSFLWNFGNGLSSISRDDTVVFNASYSQDTTYNVSLIATSEHGCRDTINKNVIVRPDPVISLTADRTAGCGPLTVNFSSSGLNINQYFWDFGNGTTSNLANPSAVFQNRPDIDTVYQVRLWASSSFSCVSDTQRINITVRPDPVANFGLSRDSICGSGNINFLNLSQSAATFNWNFDNGQTSTQVNPGSNFTMDPNQIAIYNVRLISTSIYGCNDTMIRPVSILPVPRARITADLLNGCTPLDVQFADTSHLGDQLFWDFGDGDTLTGVNPLHTFINNAGVFRDFEVVLRARTQLGCTDFDTLNIRVHPLPRPNFISNKTGICDTSSYEFSNLSSGIINSYFWDFGDGNTSTQTEPVHIYPSALSQDSIFSAKLIATTDQGCIDSISKFVVVNPLLFAAASINNTAGCSPLNVNFTSLSRNATQYYWEFGDGFISVQPNPSHTYINPDTVAAIYNVSLVVNNRFGCADTVRASINLQPNVNASFTFNKTPRCDVAEFQFINNSSGGIEFNWDFGDGTTSNAYSPRHVFPTALNADTNFTVRLIVRSSSNCYDTMQINVRVDPLVIANFSVNNPEACGFSIVNFTNNSRNGRFYIWDFGDGSGSALQNPTHPYGIPGNFTPSLIVFDGRGCSDTFVSNVQVVIWEIPTAGFIASPNTLRLPQSTFTVLDLSNSSLPLNYDWNFGEPASGQNNTSTLRNPAHTYLDSGTYTITQIINNGRCYDTAISRVRVEYYFPIASFTQDPDTGCAPHTVNFTNTSQYATSYRWFFGDGGQSTLENPSHTYIVPGTYTVTLIATGPGGIDDTTKENVIVVRETPVAAFFSSPTTQIAPNNNFEFINTSIGGITWQWSVFDSLNREVWNSTQENPIAIIPYFGQFDARLIAINQYGCRDTAFRNNYISYGVGGYIIVPDAFTPNGDGTNDGFRPNIIGVQEEGYLFQVFNRWGEKVFETKDLNGAWDGTFGGKPAQIDVYVWQVRGVFFGGVGFTEFGRVTLMR